VTAQASGAARAEGVEVWLLRHGQTEWSQSGRHTGCSDLELTEAGEEAARVLRPALARTSFDQVFTSPLQRARRTAELAGLEPATIDPELVEWDYGEYEGLTRDQVRERHPGWSVWKDGAPGGESPQEVGDRADGLVKRYQSSAGRIVLVAHGHILRVLAARWIGQPVTLGEHLPLDTATVSVLGFDRGLPVVQRWNCEVS
jgi:broad specificity phosphatase PhoE